MSKEVAEKTIVESLDNAILDMVQQTVSADQNVPRLVKVGKKRAPQVLPENFFEVVETVSLPPVSSETSVEVLEVKDVKVDKPRRRSTGKKLLKKVATKQTAKKGKKLKGFFGRKSKNVTRETLKTKSRMISPYWNLGTKMSNVYSAYKKNVMTATLAVLMLGFVTTTTYVTYAYVVSRDADLVSSVAQHVVLPANETPKVYIIQSEKADLFKNPLFRGIQVGDNVLTYTKEGRVIIYRASEDKVVNIVNLK